MKTSPVYAHDDPGVWEKSVWLLEKPDIFISVTVLKSLYVKSNMMLT